MENIFTRTELLIGKAGLDKLKTKRVAIIGVGGVGSFAAEAIARAGVGNIVLVDGDEVSVSNINRQILALHSTLGKPKVEVMEKRIMDINPKINTLVYHRFYDKTSSDDLLTSDIDYVVDAIDTMRSKIHLIYRCKQLNIPVISSMGAGNKMDPTAFKVADLSKTSICPVARIMRRELRKLGLEEGLKVVYSTEPPIKPHTYVEEEMPLHGRGSIPGSISFVPSAMGLVIASEVIKDLLKI